MRGVSNSVLNAFTTGSLLKRDGDELETHYRHVLESLGKEKGMLGVIFRKAQNKIRDPAKLRRLIHRSHDSCSDHADLTLSRQQILHDRSSTTYMHRGDVHTLVRKVPRFFC